MKQYPGSRKATLEQQGLSMESTIQICVSRPEEAVYTLDVCRFWRKLWSFFTENGRNEPNGSFVRDANTERSVRALHRCRFRHFFVCCRFQRQLTKRVQWHTLNFATQTRHAYHHIYVDHRHHHHHHFTAIYLFIYSYTERSAV